MSGVLDREKARETLSVLLAGRTIPDAVLDLLEACTVPDEKLDVVVLTKDEAALALETVEAAFPEEYGRDRLRELHELAARLGADLPPFEDEEEDA